MPLPAIKPGDAITALLLNTLIDGENQRRGLGSDGAPGAGMRVGQTGRREYIAAVVGRTVPAGAGPFKLHQMSYTVNCPELKNDGPVLVDWTRRIVDVPSVLNGPDADPAFLYFPAPIVGSAEQNLTPWRGYCKVIVLTGVGPAGGPPIWFVDMWGENPAWGCPS